MRVKVGPAGANLLEELELSAFGGNSKGVTILAEDQDGAGVEITFTHMELCTVIVHYRERCNIEEVQQALGVEAPRASLMGKAQQWHRKCVEARRDGDERRAATARTEALRCIRLASQV